MTVNIEDSANELPGSGGGGKPLVHDFSLHTHRVSDDPKTLNGTNSKNAFGSGQTTD